MSPPSQASRVEPRWPIALAILSVLLLQASLSDRIRVLPLGVPVLLFAGILVPTVAVMVAADKARWLRAERVMTFLFCVVVLAISLIGLEKLIYIMVFKSEDISGIVLLASAIALWPTIVVTFSLLYWQIDRGGPEARAHTLRMKPDWLFPQTGAPGETAPDWQPSFVDYLFLGFTTATAFSPTDTLPLTARAKMLMMLQSAISLVTIAVVASRAINILR